MVLRGYHEFVELRVGYTDCTLLMEGERKGSGLFRYPWKFVSVSGQGGSLELLFLASAGPRSFQNMIEAWMNTDVGFSIEVVQGHDKAPQTNH